MRGRGWISGDRFTTAEARVYQLGWWCEVMGEGRAGLSVPLTVGVLLEVRELFWREFALGFSHFSGSGGCRVQKPFDSTAQRQYTPTRHASRCDAPAERDTGVRLAGRMVGSSDGKQWITDSLGQPSPLSATTTDAR